MMNREQYLLMKVMEECAELAKVAKYYEYSKELGLVA